jgi:hypothetical protein
MDAVSRDTGEKKGITTEDAEDTEKDSRLNVQSSRFMRDFFVESLCPPRLLWWFSL